MEKIHDSSSQLRNNSILTQLNDGQKQIWNFVSSGVKASEIVPGKCIGARNYAQLIYCGQVIYIFILILTSYHHPMRALLRPLAVHAAYSPIEVIVPFFVLGTLAYFHVLSAIKHSSFFAPTYPFTWRPAHALLRDSDWVAVSESKWQDASFSSGRALRLELQQFAFSMDDSLSHNNGKVSAL